MTLTNQYTWEEVVNKVADQIENKNPNFNRKDFVNWYKTKEYIGKPFDPILIYKCYEIYKRLNDDKDNVTVVCGLEGDGKTTEGINVCNLISQNFNFSNTCFTKEELIEQMKIANKTDSILADEGGIMLFSREAMNLTNRLAIKLFMGIRAKNINFVICVPNFFNIDSYLREHRINMLLQIKRRGYYRGFNRKGISELNKWARNKDVFSVRMSTDKFWDGTFNKDVSSTYDYEKYLIKKNKNIEKYLDEALKDTSDTLEGMIPITKVARKIGVDIRTLKKHIEKVGITPKRIGSLSFISESDYKKLTNP